ncbi:MAG: hypothetical protein U0V18_09945 [Anaerolineales bacterium]
MIQFVIGEVVDHSFVPREMHETVGYALVCMMISVTFDSIHIW